MTTSRILQDAILCILLAIIAYEIQIGMTCLATITLVVLSVVFMGTIWYETLFKERHT